MIFGSFKNVAYRRFVYKLYISNFCINKIWIQITYKGCYAIKPNKPTVSIYINTQDLVLNNLLGVDMP